MSLLFVRWQQTASTFKRVADRIGSKKCILTFDVVEGHGNMENWISTIRMPTFVNCKFTLCAFFVTTDWTQPKKKCFQNNVFAVAIVFYAKVLSDSDDILSLLRSGWSKYELFLILAKPKKRFIHKETKFAYVRLWPSEQRDEDQMQFLHLSITDTCRYKLQRKVENFVCVTTCKLCAYH